MHSKTDGLFDDSPETLVTLSQQEVAVRNVIAEANKSYYSHRLFLIIFVPLICVLLACV